MCKITYYHLQTKDHESTLSVHNDMTIPLKFIHNKRCIIVKYYAKERLGPISQWCPIRTKKEQNI